MKTKGYVLFAFLAGLIVVSVASIIVFFAVTSNTDLVFPQYAYREYIDRTESKVFKNNAGAQLYEAENAVLSSGAYAESNGMASGKRLVNGIRQSSTLKFEIEFDEDCTVQLIFSICYVSPANRETSAENLFLVYLNDEEQNIKRANVSNCYNHYDFKETQVCPLNVSAGNTILELVAVAGGYTVDYMVLIPISERDTDEQPIGVPSYEFNVEEAARRYEAEKGERSGSLAVYDESVSGSYYMFNTEKGDSVSFYIESTAAEKTALSICLNNCNNGSYLKDLCEIQINGTQLTANPELYESDKFIEVAIGEIELVKGLNEIKAVGTGLNYYLDYIILNADINYSANKDAIRFEAEHGTLNGNCLVESNEGVSGGANVGYNYIGSSVELAVNSMVEDTAYLSVCMSYTGELSVLGEVIAVTVNGQPFNLNGAIVKNTGGYEYYDNFFLGKISVGKGLNNVTVTSVSGDYNLDYITLSHPEYAAGKGAVKFEAEQAALSDGCQSEYNVEASGGQDVGFNTQYSSINFAIYSGEELTVKLTLSLSCLSTENSLMSEYFTIKVNGKNLDIYDLKIISTGSWTVFAENFAGEMRLEEGLNTISIISKNGLYNVDYILLESV